MASALPSTIVVPSAASVGDRISLADIHIVAASGDHPKRIVFDLLVDGHSVGWSLEWLDEDDDLAWQDSHRGIDWDILDAANRALGDGPLDIEDIHIVVVDLLRNALANYPLLRSSECFRQHDLHAQAR